MIVIVKFIKYKRGNIVINFILVTIISALTIFMCFIKEDSTVVVDGKQLEPVTYQKTFSSTLASNAITPVDLKVFVDNRELNIKSTEKNIAEMLKAQRIAFGATDKISPSLETQISSDMKIIITRFKTVTETKKKPIDFKTVIKADNNTLTSQSKVSQVGKPGEKSVTSNVTYENGKEIARELIKETVIKAPQSKIIVQGTLKAITFSRGGSSNNAGKIINVKATAYSAADGINSAYTSSGKKAVRNPNGYSTIAVDPRIIPMGTKLYVEGYGYAVAADTGSGIKGNFVDVFFNTNAEVSNWGVKYIKVQLLN
ncbi:3D domain-containing protein [Clostridium tagluense]|uniref:3D domain-containing protein n=1 Tax=Clostridium tagluense TaxID=360422 RepID=UPI001C6E5727|nr:3D domain-containing protein [Clostridium tagluense]MBW9157683.1 G5 domain-containing protein [Clostridium tagluense]WLC66864.1 G5 domain-containing protein [Clostridium tagluense]